jgi:hypothetical protein
VPFVKCGPTEGPSALIATPMLLLKSVWKYPRAWECYPFSRPSDICELERSWNCLIPMLGLALGTESSGVTISRHESFKQVPLGDINVIVRPRPFEVVLQVFS